MTSHYLPSRLIQLGTVLDLAVRSGREVTFVREWSGWLMTCTEAALHAAPGRARLVLARATHKRSSRAQPKSETYLAWHAFEPTKTYDVLLPDAVPYVHGRVTRIGYRSNKWQQHGRTVDYEHSFSERGHREPLIWTDAEDIHRSTAAMILGGDFRVTARGID